jgi:hypothetical protein
MGKKIKSLFIKVLATIAVCLSFAYLSTAQNNLGVVTGSVLDMQGAAIPGSNVILTRKGSSDVIDRTTTNDEGKFTFSRVSAGEYQIEISVSFIDRIFRKQIAVKPAQESRSAFVLNLEPCFGEEESGTQSPLTDDDRAAITREIINLRFPKLATRIEKKLPKIIFSDVNIQPNWLSPEQINNISILSRGRIQDITEQTGGFTYYSISTMTKHGSCISLSLNENVTVKSQIEDANMAGGGTFY